MMGFETLSFLTPWALAGLAILPIIYWLLRFTPPKPKTIRFPPFRLLLDLVNKEQETDKAPWWLVLLRLTLAAAIIIAVAQPILTANKNAILSKSPLLIILDNDWSTANNWQLHQTVLDQTIQAAVSSGTPVTLATTAKNDQRRDLRMQTAKTVQQFSRAILPQSLPADYISLLEQLKNTFAKAETLQIIWLSNGLGGKQADTFSIGLKTLANNSASLTIALPSPNTMPITIGKLIQKSGKIEISLHKTKPTNAPDLFVSLLAKNGRKLAQNAISFQEKSSKTTIVMDLPLALRNEAARVEISNQSHAAAIRLFDDNWRKKTVGIITSGSSDLVQPLLSPLYYVTRALSPSTSIVRPQTGSSTADMVKAGLSMLVLADIGLIAPNDRTAIENWVAKGGVLVRFAGPRLAGNTGTGQFENQDQLIPVDLRRGGRALGSALSWEQPQGLAAFSPTSPLAGLTIDKSIKVRRQVLAEPTADLTGRVWASLEDGTPLITAKNQGQGLVVLIHVTANSDWSNLPLTGSFVEILKRIVDLAPAVTSTSKTATKTTIGASQSFVPQTILDGFGRFAPAPPGAKPIKLQDFAKITPSRQNPAGFYQRGGAVQALNLIIDPKMLTPLNTSVSNATITDYTPAPVLSLAGWFFTVAFVLLLIDTFAALVLMGGLQRIKSRKAVASSFIAVFLLAAFFVTGPAYAQTSEQQQTPELSAADKLAMAAVNRTRFAFVQTGDETIDATSYAGLSGLNLALAQRTSVDPGKPAMVDLEKDPIVFYPLLYWPVLENAVAPSDAVVKKLTSFMRNGGTIFFDTRDQNATFANLTGNVSPATRALRRILAKFDIPALEPVPPRHVLTRAFYLMQKFPGRWLNGKLWVEASTTDKSQVDGVSSIIIGANDYASAWAIDDTGRPLYATIPGTPRQREFSYRTGINIVMYSLTGNYKADQVHVPALLERLGE